MAATSDTSAISSSKSHKSQNTANSLQKTKIAKAKTVSKRTTSQASALRKIRSFVKWKIPLSQTSKKTPIQTSATDPNTRERVISDYKIRKKYIVKDTRPIPDGWQKVPPIYSRKVLQLINSQAKSCLMSIEDQQEKKRLRKLLETFSNFMEPKLTTDVNMPPTLIHGYLFDKKLNMKINDHYDSSVRYAQQSHLMVRRETVRNDSKSEQLQEEIKELNGILSSSLSQSKTSFESMLNTIDQLYKKEEKEEILQVLHDEFEEYFKGNFNETSEVYIDEDATDNDISFDTFEDNEKEESDSSTE